jgi:hypothetical protein
MSGASFMELMDPLNAFSPTNHVYSSAGTFTETIPIGATTLDIETWGPPGAGGSGNTFGIGTQGGGGGSGGYSHSSYTVTGHSGQTFTVTVGTPAFNSTVVNGTFTTAVNMSAPAGGNGGNSTVGGGGAAGAAGAVGTGGNVANSAGNAGNKGSPASNGMGGPGVVGVHATGPHGLRGNFNNSTNPAGPGYAVFHYV